MDAVEPPIPVAKHVATDGFGNPGSGDSGPRFSSSADATYPTPSVKHNSSSRTNSDDPNSVFVSAKNERNGKRHCSEEIRSSDLSSPKHEYQHREQKSIKRLVGRPCSKRSRTDQTANPTNPGFNRCSLTDKSRVLRQKTAIDGKRCNRKRFKVLGKSKIDSFVSKYNLANSDAGGKNILGIYGLKMDSHNVIKDVDNLSLTELLDDSSKRPSLFQDKGKRGQNVNDSILLSVKKSYTLLPFHGSTDSQGKTNISSCPIKVSSGPSFAKDYDGEVKSKEMLTMPEKSESLRKSQLYLPNDIMKRLKLPIAPALDSLLQDTKMISSAPLSDINVTKNVHNASLPQFAWSSSHSGASKLGIDAGKCFSNRNMCQCKWVRIKSSASSDLDGEVHVYGGDSSKQQILNNLLEDVKNWIMDFSLPCHMMHREPCALADNIESHTLDEISSVGLGGLSLNDSSDATPLTMVKISCNNHQMYGCKGLINKKKEAQSSMQYHEDVLLDPSSSSNFGSCETTVHDVKKSAAVSHDFIQTGSHLKKSDGWKQLSTCKIEKPGQCPQLMAAAEVLFELTRHTDSPAKCNSSSEKIRWHDKPSEINVKSNESRPSAENREQLFVVATSSGTIHTSCQKSLKHFPVTSSKKTKVSRTSNVDKEHRRWNAASLESGVPTKQFLKRPSKEMNSCLPPVRIEKRVDIHQNFKKRASSHSYAITGAYGKDLSRGKSKRM